MSGFGAFVVAMLGACVGAIAGLVLYALCYAAGEADEYREAYLAGWEAAMAKREEEG